MRFSLLKLPLYSTLILLTISSCKETYDEPVISLEDYKIEEGFELEMVASEPLLIAPVAMDFDSKGRIWVTEMPGFMDNIDGLGEDDPTGSIKILEDLDNDGVVDHAKVFLDSLVLPRAIALVYDGLLYAEPPNLYFVEIENDQPKNRVLVDSLYAAEGNPEHQPNGLRLNVDNWIYNAKSHFRYQRKNGKWIKEPTTFRGQWGISHDNFGRLYYNDNSRQLLGDHVLPNRLVRNQFFVPKVGVTQMLTNNQRVYPLNPASVNRGYIKGVLDKDSLLVNVTAACGPLVYRGGGFPTDYNENVFVCVPEANLIKRNILTFNGDKTEAKQAWDNKEFLASYDEGFRPVSLSNGPDGNLYIVDMHRGIIGHHAYLSPYLKKKAEEKRLDTLISFGRILRVKHQDNPVTKTPDLSSLSGTELAQLLKSTNGWIRDRAQHHIIFKNKSEVIPELQELALNADLPLAQIHSLYALKGLNALNFDLLATIASASKDDVTAHAIVLMEDFIAPENVAKASSLFTDLAKKNSATVDLYLSTTVGTWASESKDEFLPLLMLLNEKHTASPIYQEAIVSGFTDITTDSLQVTLSNNEAIASTNLSESIAQNIQLKKDDRPNSIYSRKGIPEDGRTKGAKLFRQICAACHGSWGDGIEGLAPPLMKSEFMAENMDRLGLIILHGLKGPVTVNGTEYEFNNGMPGLKSNKTISDADIASIISYATSAFSDTPKQLRTSRIKELRTVTSKDGAEFTAEELLEVTGK